jgi:hypothetical protein
MKRSCRFGDKCFNSHAPITAEQKKHLKAPSRSGTPGSEKANKKGKGAGKGGAASGTNPSRIHCRNFIRGDCKNGAGCPFAHHPEEAVDEINRAKAVPKPKAKAKSRDKAKA